MQNEGMRHMATWDNRVLGRGSKQQKGCELKAQQGPHGLSRVTGAIVRDDICMVRCLCMKIVSDLIVFFKNFRFPAK